MESAAVADVVGDVVAAVIEGVVADAVPSVGGLTDAGRVDVGMAEHVDFLLLDLASTVSI